jgi:hypothetical protein
LFEEAALKCFKPPEARVKKLKAWIKQAQSARMDGNLEAYPNQYDKAEEIITFYTFALFVLSANKTGITNQILNLANINHCVEGEVSACLEKQYPPPEGYLSNCKEMVKSHPVKYIREQAKKHSEFQPLESESHLDACIETNDLVIFFEMKFTSDISHSTTFNPSRNQLARLIDVGLDVAKSKGKKLIVFLATPHTLYTFKSRLYYYKIEEYRDLSLIQKDIGWRPIDDIQNNLIAVKWIALEDLISLLYKDFNHKDKEQVIDFFKERKLT